MKVLRATGQNRPTGGGRQMRTRQMRTRHRWTWHALLRRPIPHLFVLALLFGGLYALATSRIFAVTAVEGGGDPHVPVSLLRAACACVGKNIFLIRPAQIQGRLGQTPWLDVRQTYARLPNRVIIDVVYRKPAVLWRTKVSTYAVDLLGTVLYDVRHPPVPSMEVPTTKTLPLLLSFHDTTFKSGQQVFMAPTPVQMVVAIQAGLSPMVARSVDKYHWSPFSGLAGHSRLGWWFFVGINLHKELSDRLKVLNAMYAQGAMVRNHCNYVDLESLPYPYCRYSAEWHRENGP